MRAAPGRCAALLVEAFSPAPLQGNGAAVVRLEQPAGAAWMQGLAASLQQSETAFLWRAPSGAWCLRWFTPTCEVPLCGHATLAAALALGHWGLLAPGQELPLASRSGPLAVRLEPEPEGRPAASLVLPSEPLQPLAVPEELEALLGLPLQAYWGSRLGYRVALLAPEAPLQELANPAPRLSGAERQGLVLMQAAAAAAPELFGAPADYQLRFFAPGLGINEDPVTGSAHALVAPWWMERLQRSAVRGWQCSARRGGMLCEHVRAGAVRLLGQGHLLWDGHIQAGDPGHAGEDWRRCCGEASSAP